MIQARLTAAMMLLLTGGAATALGQGATTAVYGRWTLDAKQAYVVKEEVAPDGRIAASHYELPRTLEFTSDKKMILSVGTGPTAETCSGSWKVLDEGRGKLQLEFTIGDADPRAYKLDIEFLDADRMRFAFAGHEPAMVYRRALGEPQRVDE